MPSTTCWVSVNFVPVSGIVVQCSLCTALIAIRDSVIRGAPHKAAHPHLTLDVAAHHRPKRARCCQFACYTMPLDSGTLPHVLRC